MPERLLWTPARSSARPARQSSDGLPDDAPQPTAEHYAFTTLKPIPLQLDGELLTLDAATPVRIDIAPRALPTVG